MFVNYFYWRTYDQKAIDSLEEGGELIGYEMKWGKSRGKAPADFLRSYPGSLYHVINKENYLDFIM